MSAKVKRLHYTREEKKTLLLLIEKYRDIIENKKTNAVSNKQKDVAWDEIAKYFNAQSSVKRDVDSLRKQWSNIKQDVKKKTAKESFDTYKIGKEDEGLESLSTLVLSIMNHKNVSGHKNDLDSDLIQEIAKEDYEVIKSERTESSSGADTDFMENNFETVELEPAGMITPMRYFPPQSKSTYNGTICPTDEAKIHVLEEQAKTEVRRREQQEILFEIEFKKKKMELEHKKKLNELEIAIKEAELQLLLSKKV